MFAKQSQFSYEGLIAALTPKSEPGQPRKRSYKNFLKGQLDPQLLSYIIAIVRGKEAMIPKNQSVLFETNWFRNEVYKSLLEKLSTVDVAMEAEELARAIITCSIVVQEGLKPWDPKDPIASKTGKGSTLLLL